MNETITQHSITQVIQSTMDTVQMIMEIRPKNDGINMSYNFIGHFIGFDENRLQKAKQELSREIPLVDYIKIVTMHELGHALDREALLDSLPRTKEFYYMKKNHSLFDRYNDPSLLAMIIEEHKMNIAFEITAWENAEILNRQYEIVDVADFESVKVHSLGTYTTLLVEDLRLYESCIALIDGQIA